MSIAIKARFKKQAPLDRAWGYLINSVKRQLRLIPAHHMHLAQPLRVFLTKAEKFQLRPNAVPGITVNAADKTVFLWVSEAPGGVLASIMLPLNAMWSYKYHSYLGAMEDHRDERKEPNYEDSWEW